MGWAEVWRRCAALMYTVGIWTIFTSFVYYTKDYIKEEEPLEIPEGKETRSIISEDGLKETTICRKLGSAYYAVSTTEYEPNFVPYSFRLYKYVQSYFSDGNSKEK